MPAHTAPSVPGTKTAVTSQSGGAGAASTALNPEPYAYESGFSVRWVIERQLAGAPELNPDPALGPVESPWLAWGPYLWADGLTARADGLVWECADFQNDGTHPSASGRDKVADQLLRFFERDPSARPWFLEPVRLVAVRSGGDVRLGWQGARAGFRVERGDGARPPLAVLAPDWAPSDYLDPDDGAGVPLRIYQVW
jgi:hypothetical protein